MADVYPFDRSLDPWIGLAWLTGVFVAAFLVTWLTTDVARVRRTPYVAVLSIVTAALTAGYLAWARAGVAYWTRDWGWAVVGALVTSAIMLVLVRRLPGGPRPRHLLRLIGWEGVVYGAAEGALLSVLPAAIFWQVWRSMEWTAPYALAGALAVVVSIGLIVIHHLGYWEFRGPLMRYAVLGCGVLTVAYVITGSPIVPIAGHVVLHSAMVRKGVVLPPHPHPDVAEAPPMGERLTALTAG